MSGEGQLPLCLPRDPAAPNQECEATGKKDATRLPADFPRHVRSTERCWMRSRRVHAVWGIWGRAKDSRPSLLLHRRRLLDVDILSCDGYVRESRDFPVRRRNCNVPTQPDLLH
jgi:hypothetical protein